MVDDGDGGALCLVEGHELGGRGDVEEEEGTGPWPPQHAAAREGARVGGIGRVEGSKNAGRGIVLGSEKSRERAVRTVTVKYNNDRSRHDVYIG
jgi:hypothetical protein